MTSRGQLAQKGGRRLLAGMVGGGKGATSARHTATRCASTTTTSSPQACSAQDADASARIADRSLGVPRTIASTATTSRWPSARRRRDDGVDVVTVATPNDSHFAIAGTFLRKGISVVCEKPLTTDSASAAELVAMAESSGAILAVPHCYSAYAMVREAARACARRRTGRRSGSLPSSTRRDGRRPRSSSPDTSRLCGARTPTSPAGKRRRRPRHARIPSPALHHRAGSKSRCRRS